jgi:3-mercaptopyruvate sulfurtransferase SseA
MSSSSANVLVTTEWLADHLDDATVVVAEVDENPDLYEDGHIPGAVKLHWRDDLQHSLVRNVVTKQQFETLMGERGISNDTTVVLYGDKNNWFAAYAYWYLKVFGHRDVRLLDGGRQKWIDEGRDIVLAMPSPTPAPYVASEPDESIRVRRDDVLAGLGTSRKALRDPGTFLGRSRFRGRPPFGTTARSRTPTSSVRSTRRRGSPKTRRSVPTAGSASARRTRGSCCGSSSATSASETTTARGWSGAISSTCP